LARLAVEVGWLHSFSSSRMRDMKWPTQRNRESGHANTTTHTHTHTQTHKHPCVCWPRCTRPNKAHTAFPSLYLSLPTAGQVDPPPPLFAGLACPYPQAVAVRGAQSRAAPQSIPSYLHRVSLVA